MRKLISLLIVGILVTVACAKPAHSGAIRISQIYSGGGNDAGLSTPYNADYIELFNSGASPQDVGGWLLAYGGFGTTSFGCSGCTNALPAAMTIAPCGYLLVQVSPKNAVGNGSDIPAPDATLLFGLGIKSSGVVALLSTGTPSGTCIVGQPGVEDLVGWGGTSCAMGSTLGLPGLDNTHALLRKGDGMTWTGDNYQDFVLGVPAPRSSASSKNVICVGTPAKIASWGNLKSIYR